MRIVQALGWYYPESLGGTEVYVAGLAHRLSAAGHDVLIAAPDPAHDYERTYEYDGLTVYRFPIPKAPTRDECQERVAVRGTERFHKWLAERRPHVVHLHTLTTGLGSQEIKVAKALGARVIVTTHSSGLGYLCQRGTMMRWGEYLCDGICRPAKCASCELERRGLPRPLASVIGITPPRLAHLACVLPGKMGAALAMSDLIGHNAAKQREMLETIDSFVVLTKWAQEAVAANGAPRDKLVLNRLGLSCDNFTKKPGPEIAATKLPIKLGYLGRFDQIKGVDDLAHAIASLPRDAAFLMEFRGPVNSDLERGVKDRLRTITKDDPRVIFAPAVPQRSVQNVLKSYDVLCCPSVCLEGGPTVAIEAQAVGTPVIGTRIGGLAELVTDGLNGRLVPPGDWGALSDVLAQVVANPRDTIDVWRRALPPVRTMDAVAADYLDLYVAA